MEQIVDIQEMKIVNAGSIKQTASHSCHIYFRLERNSTAIPSPRLNSPSAKRFAKCGFKESDRTPASQAAILAGGASEAIAAGYRSGPARGETVSEKEPEEGGGN